VVESEDGPALRVFGEDFFEPRDLYFPVFVRIQRDDPDTLVVEEINSFFESFGSMFGESELRSPMF